MDIEDVMTFTEAARRWGLSDGAVLRMAVQRGQFNEGEVRKSDKVWLVTRAAMERLFGPEKK